MKVWIVFVITYREGADIHAVYAKEADAEAELQRLKDINKGARSHGFSMDEFEVTE